MSKPSIQLDISKQIERAISKLEQYEKSFIDTVSTEKLDRYNKYIQNIKKPGSKYNILNKFSYQEFLSTVGYLSKNPSSETKAVAFSDDLCQRMLLSRYAHYSFDEDFVPHFKDFVDAINRNKLSINDFIGYLIPGGIPDKIDDQFLKKIFLHLKNLRIIEIKEITDTHLTVSVISDQFDDSITLYLHTQPSPHRMVNMINIYKDENDELFGSYICKEQKYIEIECINMRTKVLSNDIYNDQIIGDYYNSCDVKMSDISIKYPDEFNTDITKINPDIKLDIKLDTENSSILARYVVSAYATNGSDPRFYPFGTSDHTLGTVFGYPRQISTITIISVVKDLLDPKQILTFEEDVVSQKKIRQLKNLIQNFNSDEKENPTIHHQQFIQSRMAFLKLPYVLKDIGWDWNIKNLMDLVQSCMIF